MFQSNIPTYMFYSLGHWWVVKYSPMFDGVFDTITLNLVRCFITACYAVFCSRLVHIIHRTNQINVLLIFVVFLTTYKLNGDDQFSVACLMIHLFVFISLKKKYDDDMFLFIALMNLIYLVILQKIIYVQQKSCVSTRYTLINHLKL